MIAIAASVFAASLLGSPHCAGMCGGFVAFYAGSDGRAQKWAHVAYNLGRLVAYVALGVFAGLIGHMLDRVGAAAGLQRAAAIAAGAVMVVWGAAALAAALGAKLPHGMASSFLHSRVGAVLRAVHAQPPAVRALAVGLVTALLPCGWLWVYVATATGTASVPAAALVMGAFWLGTVPMMAGLGIASQRMFGPLRRRLPVFTSAVLVVLGLLTIGGKFQMAGSRGASCPANAAGMMHGGR